MATINYVLSMIVLILFGISTKSKLLFISIDSTEFLSGIKHVIFHCFLNAVELLIGVDWLSCGLTLVFLDCYVDRLINDRFFLLLLLLSSWIIVFSWCFSSRTWYNKMIYFSKFAIELCWILLCNNFLMPSFMLWLSSLLRFLTFWTCHLY